MSTSVFLIRHGATVWSAEQRHNGSTDMLLTENGVRQLEQTKAAFIGSGRLIDPAAIRRVYSSPRTRALKTAEILFPTIAGTSQQQQQVENRFEVTNFLQEWDYGEYEGKTRDDVFRMRSDQGVENSRDWNIWRDGCVGGESPDDVSSRLQHFVSNLKHDIAKKIQEDPDGKEPQDIVCIAHSHILSSLALVWADIPIKQGVRLILQTAGVAVLGFEHDDLTEPAIFIGIHPR